MKTKLILPIHFWIVAGMLVLNFSCRPTSPPQLSEQQNAQDSTEIAKTIHDFYSWHHGKIIDTVQDINFMDDTGNRYRLKQDMLQKYLDNLYASGFVSRSFVENERQFYLECEKLWQREIVGEVPSCMDGDHFFCAQEWDLKFWLETPLSIDYISRDSAAITLIGKAFDLPMERKFSLIREDGSWKMAFIKCDMGF